MEKFAAQDHDSSASLRGGAAAKMGGRDGGEAMNEAVNELKAALSGEWVWVWL